MPLDSTGCSAHPFYALFSIAIGAVLIGLGQVGFAFMRWWDWRRRIAALVFGFGIGGWADRDSGQEQSENRFGVDSIYRGSSHSVKGPVKLGHYPIYPTIDKRLEPR